MTNSNPGTGIFHDNPRCIHTLVGGKKSVRLVQISASVDYQSYCVTDILGFLGIVVRLGYPVTVKVLRNQNRKHQVGIVRAGVIVPQGCQ